MSGYSYNFSTKDFKNLSKDMLSQKSKAIQQVYEKWGKILMLAIRQETPADTRRLLGNINYEVKTRNYRGTLATVKLVVGVLGKDSKAVDYLKFILNGSEEHRVSFKQAPKLLSWALRKGVVVEDTTKNGKKVYRYRDHRIVRVNKKTGKRSKTNPAITGIKVRGWPNSVPSNGYQGELDYFNKIAMRHERQIRQAILEVIQS